MLKPPPEYEEATRPTLQRVADAAKQVDSHYRFALYSDATILGQDDPDAPEWPLASPPRAPTQPTVCSALIRQAMINEGLDPDPDQTVPLPSDVRGNAPPGLFFYDEDERAAAARALFARTHNEVQHQIAMAEAEVFEFLDDNWWWVVPAAPVVDVATFETVGVPLGTASLVGASQTATLIEWATDAPNDVANQVVNCFASDDCAVSAKDHQNWRNPGTGIAVSPDDTLNHYDSPETGGIYGFHEPMIYRGKRNRPLFSWQAAEGTRTLEGVVLSGGTPVPESLVEVLGLDEPPRVTDAGGQFSIDAVPGPNISLRASKVIDGAFHEGLACYRSDPDAVVVDGTELLQRVDCGDFVTPLDPPGVLHSTVVIELQPPPATHRRVTLTGRVELFDCDCLGDDNDVDTVDVFGECRVGPEVPSQPFTIGKNDLCVDEVGVSVEVTCTLEADNAVRLVGTTRFFEGNENSCGTEEEDSATFEVLVPQDQTQGISIGRTLFHQDECFDPFPRDCSDSADFRNTLSAINEPAE